MCVSNWPRSRPTGMSSGSAESTSPSAARWSARGPMEAGPDFEVPRYLHPSQLSEDARARADVQREAIAEAEATVTAGLFAAREPEAGL
jgi:hypothetical protein